MATSPFLLSSFVPPESRLNKMPFEAVPWRIFAHYSSAVEGCLFSPGLPSFYPLFFPLACRQNRHLPFLLLLLAVRLFRLLFVSLPFPPPLSPPAITLTLKDKLPELVKCLFSAFLMKHKLVNPNPHPPISVESASFSPNPSFQGFRETKTPFHSTWPPLSPTRCKLAIRVIMRRHHPTLAGTGICIRDRVGYWARESDFAAHPRRHNWAEGRGCNAGASGLSHGLGDENAYMLSFM